MRKVAGVLFAAAMMLPVAFMASPAGAAGGTTCAAPSGTITILPGLTTVKKVQTISFNLPLKSCKGGGVSGGSIKGSEKTLPINIATFSTGKPLPLSATVTWNTKATSTFTAIATTKTTKTGISYVIKSKISKGLFAKLTLTTSGTVGFGKPGKGGAISNLILKGTKPFTIA
jgi:hypothetical protein